MTIYEKSQQEIVNVTSEKLKSVIKPPEWSLYVKTGVGKERPPVNQDWWYLRAASILRRVYLTGPVGVNKLKTKYGAKKNRGHKPGRFYDGSGKIIRTILQQLEEAELIKKVDKGVRKGKIITGKGISLIEKNESRGNKEEKVKGTGRADDATGKPGATAPAATGTDRSDSKTVPE